MTGEKRLTNSTTGGPVFVDVKDGRIMRIIPMDLTDEDAASWEIEARGRKFSPPRKATITPVTAAQKSMIYSPKRLLYPMKRVDFDPNGERNCDKRGSSGYERISWEEALDIVSKEMIRIKRDFGPAAILSTASSQHLWGNVGYRFSALFRFMNLAGFTYAGHTSDSWEGWHWGGMHTWGFSWRNGNPPQYDLLEDGLQNTDTIVFWSADPEVNNGLYSAFESTPRRFWLKELGVKMIFIDPYFNHSAGLFADKWFSPRPGTDAALAAGIAYVWITEELYDKEYVATRTHGFDQWKAYLLGEEDGTPKTPEWAANETRIPAREIKALAREWGTTRTTLAAGGLGGLGGAGRSATGNEWARFMICLAAMQGMGKPGRNMWSTTQGAPCDESFYFPGYAEGGIAGVGNPATGQHIPRLRVPEAILDGELKWHGHGSCNSSIEAQFQECGYPAPGDPRIQMYYRYGGSFIGTMTETNRYVKMYQTDKLPFAVNQSIWFEGEVQFADIILPACTNFERWDISEFANSSGCMPHTYSQCNHRIISLQAKCIEPLGESKSDYEIFAELSKRLGLWDVFTDGGKTELDWVKQIFCGTDLPKAITWEKFFEKGYYVVPNKPKGAPSTPAMQWFAEGRRIDTPDSLALNQIASEGLQTSTGKIEFESTSLMAFDPNDEERSPVAKYVPSWEGHRSSGYHKYPLQLVSPHPRFSFHTMGDLKDSWLNEIRDHRVLKEDGHRYWIIRLNTQDAAVRGIHQHDLIKVFNDRGAVIMAAQITERIPAGTVHSYESCADYQAVGKAGESPDRAGCINLLTPKRSATKNSSGIASNSCLVQIEKWDEVER